MIELKNITVSRNRAQLLSDVSLKIDQGEFIGICGQNGAGKTTLLKVILGMMPILQGEISVFGNNYKKGFPLDIRKQMAYVPQVLGNDSYTPLNVEDVISIGRAGKAGLFRKLTDYDKEQINSAAEVTGISHLLKKPIGQLSGGERKKVSIARAIAQEPKLLILDEPLNNLDIVSQKNILQLIEKIYFRKKISIVLVMHHIDLFSELCNRIVLLKQGKVFFDGDISLGMTAENLSLLYDMEIDFFNRKKIMSTVVL